jgi:ABC-type branched-subunit amino acid transport system substrate-binding protein
VRALIVSRREFLSGGIAAGATALTARTAWGEDAALVGLVVPADGTAMAMEQGAALGLDEANALATLFGKRLQLRTESVPDREGAARAGAALVQAGAMALVGGRGAGFADALREVAAAGGPLFLNVAAPDDRLRQDGCARQMFHVIPSVTMYVDAAAQWADRRRLVRWAVVGDGTPRAREIEAAARRALARRAGAALVAEAEADLVLLAEEGPAAREVLARARAAGRGARVFGIGGALPEELPPDAAAGDWIVGWHRDLVRFSASELNGRFRQRFARPLAETSWAAWAALKMSGEALVRAGARDGAALRQYLGSAPPFDGHKGTALTFRPWDQQLRQPVYVIGPRPGAERAGFTVLADLPGANLDAIGILAAESRCRL